MLGKRQSYVGYRIERADRRADIIDAAGRLGGKESRANGGRIAMERCFRRHADKIGADLLPQSAARATADDAQGFRADTKLPRAVEDIAHRESKTFKQCPRQVLDAMRGGEAIEGAPRRGDPFGRHRAGKCGNEGHPAGARRRVPGEHRQLLEARKPEGVAEPDEGTARQPAGILDVVLAAHEGMGLDQPARIDHRRGMQGACYFRCSDHIDEGSGIDQPGADR